MAYLKLTGVASFDAVLGEIRDFLNATGDWTILQNLIAPDYDVPDLPLPNPQRALGRQLRMSNGDCLVCLRSTTNHNGANRLYMLDGYPPNSGLSDNMNGNSGMRWDTSIASTGGTGVRNSGRFDGPFPTVHFFTNDPSTYCYVAIEVTAGVYRHLCFGNLVKYGTWTGGGFYGLTNWESSVTFISNPNYSGHTVPFDNGTSGITHSTTVHYEFDTFKWLTSLGGVNTRSSVTLQPSAMAFRGGFGRAFVNLPESPYSGLIALAPVLVGALRLTDNPDTLRWIGHAPDMAQVNIQNLAPGEEYSIGSDVWLTFPLCAKNGASGQFNSGTYGVAYRKNE